MTETSATPWHRHLLAGTALAMLLAASLSIAVSQILLGGALVALVLGVRRDGLPRTGLALPTVLLAAWALLMVPLSTDPGQSFIYYRRFYLFAALWVAAAVAVDEVWRRRLAVALFSGGLVLAGWSILAALLRSGDVFGQRMGEMSNPMTSGALLMMTSLVGVAVVATDGLGRRVRVLASAAVVVLLLALAQTLTRSAWLGFLAGAGTMALVLRPRLAAAGGVLVAGVVTLVVLMPPDLVPRRLADRVDPDLVAADKATLRRLETWRGGLAIVADRPWTGVGDRGLTEVGPAYYGDETTVYHGHMHNNLIQFAVIWGVPGLLLAVGLFVAQFVVPLKRLRRLVGEPGRGPPWARAWLLGALGVVVGFFVAGLTEWYFGDAESYQMFAAILGVALGGAGAGSNPRA